MNSHTLLNTSIIVLPFINLSSDRENEYFSDGITEEIINALTRVAGLKVLARTTSFSFKGKNIDVRKIGEQVNVQSVLEGSVRKSGKRFRITAQLIETVDGTHLWSENFDRELTDIFALQDEISLQIADRIRENFGHFDIQEHLVQKQTDSIRAYELFLEARFHQLQWSPKSLQKAVELYTESTWHDDQFARSYYGLVQSYGLLAAWGYMPQEESFQLAGESFLKARDIDTTLPEYQMSLIGKSFWGEWDFPLAYQLLLQTLEIFPHYSDAVEAIAELMIANGYFDRAEKHIRTALETDPLSANHHYTLGNIFYFKKDFVQALEFIDKALKIYPDFQLPKELRLMCYTWLNDRQSMNNELSESKNPHLAELLFEVVNNKSFRLETEQVKQLLESSNNQNLLVPYELFILANSAEHSNEALEVLTQYIKQKRGQIVNFRYEPFLACLQQLDTVKKLYPKSLELNKTAETKTNPSKTNEKLAPEEIDKLNTATAQLINEIQVFLDPKVNLRGLADEMSVHPNKLSLFINQKFGKNFNEFINEYRLKHFQEIALNPKYEHLSILGKALESGFNSKTAFNSFFKKQTGLSPKGWIKQNAK